MKKRKFIKSNIEREQLKREVKWLKSSKGALIKENSYLRERPDPISEDIYFICNRYESGFGHGVSNDGFDLSKTPHSEKHLGVAYQIGYEAGQRRYKDNL